MHYDNSSKFTNYNSPAHTNKSITRHCLLSSVTNEDNTTACCLFNGRHRLKRIIC
uniref:Uncharacterized protein n=1 Tax=Octopus bimaculoides TaxID=37653 RepID=A0A0L8HNE0_OCTBM